jgi:hypothetical protein
MSDATLLSILSTLTLQIERARNMELDFEQCLRMEVAVNDALSRQPDFRYISDY